MAFVLASLQPASVIATAELARTAALTLTILAHQVSMHKAFNNIQSTCMYIRVPVYTKLHEGLCVLCSALYLVIIIVVTLQL